MKSSPVVNDEQALEQSRARRRQIPSKREFLRQAKQQVRTQHRTRITRKVEVFEVKADQTRRDRYVHHAGARRIETSPGGPRAGRV